MPNIGLLLKEEIRRLARKETRPMVTKLRTDVAVLKRTLAEHKRLLATLERDNRRFVKELDARRAVTAKVAPETLKKARITGKMVKRLRAKLRISQADIARLLGVNQQTVYLWEQKKGRLTLRDRTKAAFVGLRGIGVREARARLKDMEEE